jgi:hypothetical protein
MLVQDLKNIIRNKTLARQDTSLLKYVLSESERYNKTPVSVIEKLIEDNNKSYSISNDSRFIAENEVLKEYLPVYISVEAIADHIKHMSLDDSGKSMGLAIKHLKTLDINFRNDDVKNAIKYNNKILKP